MLSLSGFLIFGLPSPPHALSTVLSALGSLLLVHSYLKSTPLTGIGNGPCLEAKRGRKCRRKEWVERREVAASSRSAKWMSEE